MNNAIILAQYCEKKLLTKSNLSFLAYMRQNPSFILTLLDGSNLTKEEKLGIEKLQHHLKIQEDFNSTLGLEINNLYQKVFNWVGFKGLFLQKAYYPAEYTRLFGDVDILVKDKNGYKSYKGFKRQGYKMVKYNSSFYDWYYNNEFILFFQRLSYFRYMQHVVMEKKMESPKPIVFELHGNINLPRQTYEPMFNIYRMIDESITKTAAGMTFRTFAPEDNLLYLMHHTIKHLGYVSFEESCQGGK